LRRKVKEQKD